jgi:hypothetical protein
MMHSMKELLGIASITLAIVSYVPYVSHVLRRTTKPHTFSWLVWSVLSAIGFSVQLLGNGGPGAWLAGLTALMALAVFVLSLRYGEKRILPVDWASLLLAGGALALWALTSQPLASVILISLISLIDVVGGFFPTFRKSITKPHEETASIYLLYSISLGFSLAALQSFTLTNALYPASFVIINALMAVFLVVQRRRVKE